MLITYKPDYQKITMGLLSLIPDLKETQYLTAEMDWYSKEENRHLFIWKSEETGDMVGVLGVEEEQENLLLLRHIALNPSYRHEGITYAMLTSLAERYPDKRIMGTLDTAAIVSKWQQEHALEQCPLENQDFNAEQERTTEGPTVSESNDSKEKGKVNVPIDH